MKKLIYLSALYISTLSLSSCGDGVNLPPVDVETDLYEIPLNDNTASLLTVPLMEEGEKFVHCGALHTPEDFERIKQNLDKSPWKEGYELLKNNSHAQTSYNANPQTMITRGAGTENPENYSIAFNDVAAAYQLALMWKITEDEAYAEKSIEILNGWAAKCTEINGTTDANLAAGIYGYQFAVAGELMRDYPGWEETDFKVYQDWMVEVFYPMNKDFLVRHNDTPAGHYWANWGLCNIASTMAIGILADRIDIYNEGIEHLQIGETNGRLTKAIYYVFDGEYANLAQWQESNRDQGHTYLCQGLLGVICQLAWNQGDDFFGYNDNMFLKACEYTARYNFMNMEVPNLPYTREYKGAHGTDYEEYPTISERNLLYRPIWALVYNHYAKIKGVDAEKYQYTEVATEACFPEGGGGNYGTESGGFDALGFGTLMFSR